MNQGVKAESWPHVQRFLKNTGKVFECMEFFARLSAPIQAVCGRIERLALNGTY